MSRPELTEVLAEVNRLRAERDLEPLSEMPKGKCRDCKECPLAIALDTHVGASFFGESDDFAYLPTTLHAFRMDFDNGAYPELVA